MAANLERFSRASARFVAPPRRTITAQLTKMLAQELMVPPINFACVCKGVYRSGYPNLRNLPFLKKLGLKSIL